MRKWITEKLSSDELWLSYWPNACILMLNVALLMSNLYRPSEKEWLRNPLILAGCFGIAWSIRNLYDCYRFRKERSEFRSTMDQFMQSLKPEIERIMEEEMTVEGRDIEESMVETQRKIQELIQSESDRRKIGLTVSSSDKT